MHPKNILLLISLAVCFIGICCQGIFTGDLLKLKPINNFQCSPSMASSGNTEPEKSKNSEEKTGDEKTKDTEEKISDVSSAESDDDRDSTGGTTASGEKNNPKPSLDHSPMTNSELTKHRAECHKPGHCGNKSCSRLKDPKAHCDKCRECVANCEICSPPANSDKTLNQRNKTVVLASQGDVPGIIDQSSMWAWDRGDYRDHELQGIPGESGASSTPLVPRPQRPPARSRSSRSMAALATYTGPSAVAIRTRRSKGMATAPKESWLLQLIRKYSKACEIIEDDTITPNPQYKSKLLASKEDWDEFMAGPFQDETLDVSRDLGIIPPDCIAYGVKALIWIRSILDKYSVSFEEYAECKSATEGTSAEAVLIKKVLEFLSSALYDAGFMGDTPEEFEQLLADGDEYKLIMTYTFHTMVNTWNVLKTQDKLKTSLVTKFKEMERTRATLAREVNNATTLEELTVSETRYKGSYDKFVASMKILLHRLLIKWVNHADIIPANGLIDAMKIFAGCRAFDPTASEDNCPVTSTSNHYGTLNFTQNESDFNMYVHGITGMFHMHNIIDNKKAELQAINTSSVIDHSDMYSPGPGDGFNINATLQNSLLAGPSTTPVVAPDDRLAIMVDIDIDRISADNLSISNSEDIDNNGQTNPTSEPSGLAPALGSVGSQAPAPGSNPGPPGPPLAAHTSPPTPGPPGPPTPAAPPQPDPQPQGQVIDSVYRPASGGGRLQGGPGYGEPPGSLLHGRPQQRNVTWGTNTSHGSGRYSCSQPQPPPVINSEAMKVRNWKENIKENVKAATELWGSFPMVADIQDLSSQQDLLEHLTTLTGIESHVSSVIQNNQEITKIGGSLPNVEFVDENYATEIKRSDQWITATKMRLRRSNLALERHRSSVEAGEKAAAGEIIKSFSKIELEKLNPTSNCLIWMDKLDKVTKGKVHILTSSNAAPGFASKLLASLSGEDHNRAKVYSTDPGAIIEGLRSTYYTSGLGVSLSFTKIRNLKQPLEDGMTVSTRESTLRYNLATTLEEWRCIYDQGLLPQVTNDQLKYTMNRILDKEYKQKWRSRLMRFEAADDNEKRETLRADVFDLNESTVMVNYRDPGNHNLSFFSRPPAYESTAPRKSIRPIAEQRETISAPEHFRLATVWLQSIKAFLDLNKDVERAENLKEIPDKKAANMVHELEPAMGAEKNEDGDKFAINNIASKQNQDRNKDKQKFERNDKEKKDIKYLPCFYPRCKEMCKKYKVKCEGLVKNSLHFCVAIRAQEAPGAELMQLVIDLELCPSELCPRSQCSCPNNIRCIHCKSSKHHTLLHGILAAKGLLDDDEWYKKKPGEKVNNISLGDELQMEMDKFDQDMTANMGMLTVNNINLTGDHGELINMGENFPFTCHAVRRDPESVKLLMKLIEGSQSPRKMLNIDNWDELERHKQRKRVNDLYTAILGARTQKAMETSPPVNPLPPPKHGPDQDEAFAVNQMAASLRSLKEVNINDSQTNNISLPPRSASSKDGNRISTEDSLHTPFLSSHHDRGQHISEAVHAEASRQNQNISDFLFFLNQINDQKNHSTLVNARIEYPNLHKKVIKSLTNVFNATSSKTLNFVRAAIVIPEPTPERLQTLANIPGVFVMQMGNVHIASVVCLIDPGSNITLGSREFLSALDPNKTRPFNSSITTVAGDTVIESDYRYKLSIKTGHSVHNVSSVKIGQISPERGFSTLELAILESTFGLTEENSHNIRIPFGDTMCHLLLSNDSPEITSALLPISDPGTCGFDYNVLSPSLKLTHIPWSQDHKFIVSGSFGLDPELIQEDVDFPKVIVPRDRVQEVEDKVDKFLDMMKDPQSMVASSFLAQKKLRWQASILEPDGAFDMQCFNTVITEACSKESQNQVFMSETLDPGGEHNNVLLTAEDCKKTAKFLAREAAMLTPQVLCRDHQRLQDQALQNCKMCALRNVTERTLKHEARHYELWGKVNLKDEKAFENGGNTEVEVSPTFEVPLEKIGKLENSNMKEAMEASKRLFIKAKQQKALRIVDNQFRDKIDAGYLEVLLPEEFEQIILCKICHQFVSKNIVVNLSSDSTPLRVISNTQNNIPGTDGASLVNTDSCPAHELTLLLDLSIRTAVIRTLGQGDLAKAYNSLKLRYDASLMFLTYWFLIDEDDPSMDVPIILRSPVVDFGYCPASQLLQIALVKYGTKAVILEISVKIIENSIYVDNINLDFCANPKILAEAIMDIKRNLARLSFHMNKLYLPKHLYDHPDMAEVREAFQFKEKTTSLGCIWNLVSDEVVPNTSLSLYGNHRGMPEGEKLTPEALEEVDMTRMHGHRLGPSLWDNTNRLLGPLIASGKILQSLICKAVPNTELNTPIKIFDEELAKMVKNFWMNVVKTPFLPAPRCVIKEGFKIKHVIIDHDGSHQALGAVLIVVSENEEGEIDTGTLLAKNVVSFDTTPSNENRSYSAAVSLLQTFINALKPVMEYHEMEFDASILGDNMPSTFLFKREAKCVLNRNIRATCLRTLVTISDSCPKMNIMMGWIPGRFLVSDLVSKIFLDAAEKANKSFWRKGPKEYQNIELIEHFWFLKHKKGFTTYRDLPVVSVKDDQSLEEIVKNNPMDGAPGYSVIFDDHDNKVEEYTPPTAKSLRAAKESLEVNMCMEQDDYDTMIDACVSQSDECDNCPGRNIEEDLSIEDVVNMCLNQNPPDIYDNVSEESVRSSLEILTLNDDHNDIMEVTNMCLNTSESKATADIELDMHNTPAPPDLGYSEVLNDLEIQEAIYRYYFPEDCDYVVNALTRQGAKSQDMSLLSRARFEKDGSPGINNNILRGINAPEPMTKEFYENFMMKSNNVVTLINSIVMMKRAALRKKKGIVRPEDTEKLIADSWSLIVSSDQTHFPAPASKEIHEENGFKVVYMALRGVVLPILSQEGPLLRKLLLTKHISPDNNGGGVNKMHRMTVMHIPTNSLRNRFLSGEFACFSFSLDKAINVILSQCAVCIRTSLKEFKFKPGDKASKTGGDSLFQRVSLDPTGPYKVRKHEDGRHGGLDVYFLMCSDYATGIFLIQGIGSLKHASVILGIKTLEKRCGANFKHIHVDKGSSLSAALLESPHRDWKIIQAAPTHHTSVLVENRIGLFRTFWNRFHNKFSKESKDGIVLNLYEMLYLLSNIEYQINSMPYSRHSPLAPSHFQFARGIEADMNFNDYLESLEGDNKSNKLHPLSPYLKSLEQMRNEILAEIFSKRTSVHKIHDEELYLPFSGDLVIALTGSFKTSEIAVVEQGVEDVIHNPANTDPVKQNEEISQRKVKIRTKLGEAKLYPVTSLCPLASAENTLEWDKRNPNKLTNISGIAPHKIICNGLKSFFFSSQTKEIKMNDCYPEVMMNQISFRIFYFSSNKLSNTKNCVIVSYFYVFSQIIRKNQIWSHYHTMEIYQNPHDRRVLVLLMHALYCPLSDSSQLSPIPQPVYTCTETMMKTLLLLSSMYCVMPAPVPDAFSVVGSMYPVYATNFSVQLHPEEALRCLIIDLCMHSIYFQGLSFNSNDHESNLGDGEYLKGDWASKSFENSTNILPNACQLMSTVSFLFAQGTRITRLWSPSTRTWRWEPVLTPTSGPRCWGSRCSPGRLPPLASISNMLRAVGQCLSSRERDPGPGPTTCPSLRWPRPGGWSTAGSPKSLMCSITTQPRPNEMKKIRNFDHYKMFYIFNGQALFTPNTTLHFVSLHLRKHFLLTRSSLSVFRVASLCMCVNGSVWRSLQKNLASSRPHPPPPQVAN